MFLSNSFNNSIVSSSRSIINKCTDLFFQASDGVEGVFRAKQQSILSALLFLLLLTPSCSLQLFLTISIQLPNVILVKNTGTCTF